MAARTANGWAALSSDSSLLHIWTVPLESGHEIKLKIRRGSVGFALVHDCVFWDEEVERLDIDKIMDDWGWASRPIGGTNIITNHNSGTAVDKNATRHPRGVPTLNTLTRKQVATYEKYLRMPVREGLLDWGGRWPSHPGSRALTDAMHTEIPPGVNMSQVEKYARQMIDSKARRVKEILEANPGQRRVIMS